jgi:hypothetical protein
VVLILHRDVGHIDGRARHHLQRFRGLPNPGARELT